MRSHWIRVDPKANHWCPFEKRHRATQRGGHVKTGRDWSYVTTCQGTPRSASNHQKLEEARKDSSLEPSEGAGPADTLILDLWLPEQLENKFLLF